MNIENVSVVAIFSLAWFIVGIFCGKRYGSLIGSARPVGAEKRSIGGGGGGNGKSVELYVGNLSYDTSEKKLTKTFEEHGKVQAVRIIAKKGNGHPKGYGFVEMANRSEAAAAVKALNGTEIDGREIVVNEARSFGRSHH